MMPRRLFRFLRVPGRLPAAAGVLSAALTTTGAALAFAAASTGPNLIVNGTFDKPAAGNCYQSGSNGLPGLTVGGLGVCTGEVDYAVGAQRFSEGRAAEPAPSRPSPM